LKIDGVIFEQEKKFGGRRRIVRGNRSLTALKSYIDWLKPAEKFDGFENQVISEKPSEVAISAVEVSKKKMVHMVVVVASKE